MGNNTTNFDMAGNISEKDNFLRFVAFFVDVGTETMLNVFYYCQQRDPGIITFPISSSSPVAKQLQKLPKHEYYIIKSAQNPKEFDLSILIALVSSLFSHVLPCPVNGWRGKPASTDVSISADLLRLRNIRNTIVAHRNTASLSDDDFEKYWKKITELQSKLQEFTVLWKTNRGPYFRYIKLLLEGGRCCLFGYLNTLIRKQDTSLSIVLSDNRTLLREELGSQMPINTETKNWDLYVLAVVIISVFGSSIKEKKLSKVKAIRDLRSNYAYTAVYAINNDQRFIADREDLVSCLTALSESIGGETEREFERLKEEYRTKYSTDAGVYINQLKDQDLGFKSINDVHRENLERLKVELNAKGNLDINLNDKYEVEIIIQLKCEDETKEAEAEHAVYEYMKALLSKPEGRSEASHDYPEVQKTIETINDIKTVQVKCVKKSCLLLTIECRSKQGLLTLINYVESLEFQQHLYRISIELTAQFDEVFILQAHFTVESLQRVLTNQGSKQTLELSDIIRKQLEEDIQILKREKADVTEELEAISRHEQTLVEDLRITRKDVDLLHNQLQKVSQEKEGLTLVKEELSEQVDRANVRSNEIVSKSVMERVSFESKICHLTEDNTYLEKEARNMKAQLTEAEHQYAQRLSEFKISLRSESERNTERLVELHNRTELLLNSKEGANRQKVKDMEETIQKLKDQLATEIHKCQQYSRITDDIRSVLDNSLTHVGLDPNLDKQFL